MKRIIAGFIFLTILIQLVSSYPIGIPITFTVDGVLKTPDSVRVDFKYLPSGATATYKLGPTSSVWDTTITSTQVDNFLILNYSIYSSNPTLVTYGNEVRTLPLDSTWITTGYSKKIAKQSDSGAITPALVWSYITRTVTDKTGYSLLSSEHTAVAAATKTSLEAAGSYLSNLVFYWGAVENATTVLYPNTGISPKDSAVVFVSGVRKMKIDYKKSNVPTVLDSTVTFYY